jgi:hypothetical protein
MRKVLARFEGETQHGGLWCPGNAGEELMTMEFAAQQKATQGLPQNETSFSWVIRAWRHPPHGLDVGRKALKIVLSQSPYGAINEAGTPLVETQRIRRPASFAIVGYHPGSETDAFYVKPATGATSTQELPVIIERTLELAILEMPLNIPFGD